MRQKDFAKAKIAPPCSHEKSLLKFVLDFDPNGGGTCRALRAMEDALATLFSLPERLPNLRRLAQMQRYYA